MIRPLLISLMLLVVAPSIAAAASFDCDRAATETEIAICNNPELSAYENLLRQYPDQEYFLKGKMIMYIPIAEAAEQVRAYQEREEAYWNNIDCFNLGGIPSFEETQFCSAWYYNITFAQILALFLLFTLFWSFIVATSHVRKPSKDTLKRVFFIQLLGSTGYGILKGISDPKDIVFVLSPILYVPIVLAAAWVAVKAFKMASTANKYVYSRYDNMPDYQVSQDGAERALDPRIIRFVDGSGNAHYRVLDQDFLTLYSAESYLDRLKSDTK